MTLRLVIRPEAEADLAEAFDWYEAQRTGLGRELLSEVRLSLDRMQDGTDRYAKVFRDVRRTPVRRFPYSIYFLKEEHRIRLGGSASSARSKNPEKATGQLTVSP